MTAVASTTRVPAAELRQLMDGALARRGVGAEHRGFVVDGLLRTSLRGIDTHGVRLFPTYCAELDGGRARAAPRLRWQGKARAALRLDADAALGLVAGTVAARRAAELAREVGVGAVAVANSNHFGAASVYTLEMARRGVLGLSFTNSDALVAPFGGVRPFFGTNPMSLAVESDGDELFCADMATSQVSYSRIKRAREAGGDLEPGWAVKADGGDAAGPVAAAGDVALKPLGGYKGQCLGMMVEILCAVLTGEPADHRLSHLYVAPFDRPRRVAHLFVALDVAAFTEPAEFRARLAALLAELRAQEAAGEEPVMAPGDLEAAAEADRGARGIPLNDDELARFRALDAEAPAVERLGL